MAINQAQQLVNGVVFQLRKAREARGWSQRALAKKAGVDPKTISLIERGVRSPTLYTLSLLAQAMSFPLSTALIMAEEDSSSREASI